MITEVSIRCQKNLEVAIRRIPAYTPQYTTALTPNTSPDLDNQTGAVMLTHLCRVAGNIV